MKNLKENIIFYPLAFLILIGAYFIFTLFRKKADFSIITSLFATALTIFICAFLAPFGVFLIAGLGLFILIKFIFLMVLKPRKKKEKIDLNNENSFYSNSNDGTIQIANPYRGIIVAGGAGSGKSKSLFYPIIDQLMQKRFCGVLYDFKSPELSEYAHAMHNKYPETNISFSFLDFKDYTISDRVNPIAPRYVTKQAVAFELASVLLSNLLPENIKRPDYWSRSSTAVIAGSIWYLRNNHPDKCTLPHLIAMILSFPSASLIDVISTDIECAGMISSLKEAHEMKAEKQLSGVIGTIKNALAQLNFPELYYLLSEDSINLDLNAPENPTFLCVGNDSTLSTTYAPIISLVISTCLRKMNEPGKEKSAVLIDEAPTLYIPGLEQIPATARSNKIATILGLQDYSQMVDKYGEEKAQVLMSNLGNQFFGRTVNERTVKMITNVFGKEDKEYTFISKSKGSSTHGSSKGSSVSQSVQERDRVKVSDISNLPAGKFYGIIAEGNKTELLGVQLGEVESTYKAFEKKTDVDVREVFKTIYSDVESILNPPTEAKPSNNSSIDEIKIELN